MLQNLIDLLGVRPAHPIDRLWHALLAGSMQPLSPGSIQLAFTDWLIHSAMHPARQGELFLKGADQWLRLLGWSMRELQGKSPCPCIEPLPQDKRFRDPAWQRWPFSLWYQAFLLQQQWWHHATRDVRGMHPHHAKLVNFLTREWLDTAAPSNFLPTNPQALKATMDEGGANLRRGWENLVEDSRRFLRGDPPQGAEAFPVGERLAVTPGKVVYRNRLIELIQYLPTKAKVRPEPVLIVPAWIMKYYILDLQPEDSLVRFLVDHGFTVFIISWKNPGQAERDLGFDDYRRLGVMAAIDAISAIVPGQRIHAVGYCIGGTLLTTAAASMARVDDERLHSLTLFASLVDFSEPGQLGLFIDPSQVAYLADLMWERGYLGGARMRSVFYFLRPIELIWSRNVHAYLLGKPHQMFDLMAWNADTTNMPARMHEEYLRRFYLNNDLVEGRFEVDDEPVTLLDIRVPIFVVGTTGDHIAPWKSVYKILRLTRTEVSFLLTTGGHNAGVVNPPGESHYAYQFLTRHPREKYLSADAFHERSSWHAGSWWPVWERWLAERSGNLGLPPPVGAPVQGYPVLADAPGQYVHESARVL